jgi:glycosyltransferase involved in cell wall biosynthesis
MPASRILLVNIGFLPESVGGTEYYTYNLANSLINQGYEVTVLAASEDMTLKRYQVIRPVFDGIDVIKIVNSPIYARSFDDFFIDLNVDRLFKEIVKAERPDLVHFQHLAYLSGNLPEIAHQLKVPSILTLHDYWYLCFRSRLLRPGCEVCTGPAQGMHCATCHDDSAPDPLDLPKFPVLIRILHLSLMRNLVINMMDKLPQSIISEAEIYSSRKTEQVKIVPFPLLRRLLRTNPDMTCSKINFYILT